jgi:hypothetical protein
MSEGRNRKSLKKLTYTIDRLDLDKRLAATKWLEGVIVAQILTSEERDNLVKAANEYIADVEEEEYMEAVNVLIECLARTQRNTKRSLKRTRKQSD